MPHSDWPNAVAHVDADCFFAACEIARSPQLRTVPVCVMSSQDACIVAKTYDAKAKGITTGMPVWEAKKLMPRAVYIPADFVYYGQMSDKLFAVLARYTPGVEVYSIDEAFLDMNGIRSLWRKSYGEIADMIRATVRHELGITVSIGISLTKTLAKIASESRKPDGSTIVPGHDIPSFLANIHVKDIPGIGRNRAALLNKFKIFTAADVTQTKPALLQRLLGKAGTDLWHELHGTPLHTLALTPRLPKSVARTASLGQVTADRALITAHLSFHTTRLVTELVAKHLLAKRLTVFLTLKSYASKSVETAFDNSTANIFTFTQAVRTALIQLYKHGELYRGCGVIAADICSTERRNLDLFGNAQQDERKERLLSVVDKLNKKYGNHTVTMMAAATVIKHRKKSRFRLPMYEVH